MSNFENPMPAIPFDPPPVAYQDAAQPGSSTSSLKRRASDAFADRAESTVKRAREDSPDQAAAPTDDQPVSISGQALADDLADELMCGCCSALLYRPVVVNPCQHYFCGSCCMLWVRNGGTSCPACRGPSSTVTPSRVLQLMIDILLRHDPSRARTERERAQADAIYRPGQVFRIPPPRELSPEPAIAPIGDFLRPCPHCLPGNRHGWTCPEPVPDPVAEPDRAFHVDDGSPPGHGFCGNCENLLALSAPTTTKCDFCQVSFCGISVPNRCVAAALLLQYPHNLNDVTDFVQSTDVYESFSGNTVEVDYMLDYLTARRISPRAIYVRIMEYLQTQPRKFEPLIELDLFADAPNVAAGPEVPLDSPRNRICRMCAGEILLWGLRDWWGRERHHGHLPAHILDRPDCVDGAECRLQREQAHAKEFNHIIYLPGSTPPPPPSLSSQSSIPPVMSSLPLLPELEDDDELTPPPPGAFLAHSAFVGALSPDVQALRDAVNALRNE